MNRIIHYTKNGSLNRSMNGLGDDLNIPSFLPGEGSGQTEYVNNPGTDWAGVLTTATKAANDSFKSYEDSQTAKMNINMQRMLDSRPLPPPPSNSWTRLASSNGNSVLMDNAKTIILVGGILVAGLLVLKFISKNRK